MAPKTYGCGCAVVRSIYTRDITYTVSLCHVHAKAEIGKAKEEIARERDTAMAEIRQQVADLSLTISEKVIGQALDEQGQRRLIEEFLEQTEELK